MPPPVSAVTSPESPIVAGNVTGTFPIGAVTNFQTGTHGQAWDAALRRYGRRIAGGYVRTNEQLDPRALVDPKYFTGNAILRARECIAVQFPAGIAIANNIGRFFWGFGGMPNALTADLVNRFPFAGFCMVFNINAGGVVLSQPVWRCLVVSDAMVTLHNAATAIDAREVHELTLKFDSSDSTVYWLIDNTVVSSYSPASGATPGQQNPYPNGFGTAAAAWNMLYAAANTATAGFSMGVLYRMSVCCPLITYEYSDT